MNPLIYECYDNPALRNEILTKCNNDEIKNHIQKLYDLISYQIRIISEQRREIISNKHHDSWSRYDQVNNRSKG